MYRASRNSALAIAFITLMSCRPRTFQDNMRIKSASKDSSPAVTGFVYAIMSPEVLEGKGTVTSFSASMEIGKRRLTTRNIGYFPTTGLKQSGLFPSFEDSRDTLELKCELPSASTCAAKITLRKGTTCAGESAALGMNRLECSDGRVAVLTPRSMLPIKSLAPLRRPRTDLEFFRTGPIHSGDNQALWHVHPDEPLRLHLDDQIKAAPLAMQALSKAVTYWNTAIGSVAIVIDDSSGVKSLPFSFDRSVAQLMPTFNGVAASAVSVVDPITGQILAMKISFGELPVAGDKQFLGIVVHELGHALGLAHNFEASFDPKAKLLGTPTSAMDYSEAVDLPTFETVLPYDQAAMNWVYRGTRPAQFAHCNDHQSWWKPGCDKFDSVADPVGTHLSTAENIGNFISKEKLKQLLDSTLSPEHMTYINESKKNGDGMGIYALLMMPISNSLTWPYGYKLAALEGAAGVVERKAIAFAWLQFIDKMLSNSKYFAPHQVAYLEAVKWMFESKPLNSATLRSVVDSIAKALAEPSSDAAQEFKGFEQTCSRGPLFFERLINSFHHKL